MCCNRLPTENTACGSIRTFPVLPYLVKTTVHIMLLSHWFFASGLGTASTDLLRSVLRSLDSVGCACSKTTPAECTLVLELPNTACVARLFAAFQDAIIIFYSLTISSYSLLQLPQIVPRLLFATFHLILQCVPLNIWPVVSPEGCIKIRTTNSLSQVKVTI